MALRLRGGLTLWPDAPLRHVPVRAPAHWGRYEAGWRPDPDPGLSPGWTDGAAPHRGSAAKPRPAIVGAPRLLHCAGDPGASNEGRSARGAPGLLRNRRSRTLGLCRDGGRLRPARRQPTGRGIRCGRGDRLGRSLRGQGTDTRRPTRRIHGRSAGHLCTRGSLLGVPATVLRFRAGRTCICRGSLHCEGCPGTTGGPTGVHCGADGPLDHADSDHRIGLVGSLPPLVVPDGLDGGAASWNERAVVTVGTPTRPGTSSGDAVPRLVGGPEVDPSLRRCWPRR
jgi:hypothetical protein